MNIHCLQTDIVWENKEANFTKVRRMLEQSNPEPNDLVVLPELFAAGFTMNVSAMREATNGLTESFLASLAVEFSIFIVAGFISSDHDGKGLNQSLVFNPAGLLIARYSKIHPFTLGEELKHYNRGREILFFEWAGLKVCPFICYDLRFPEIFREAVRLGAEMFVVIANWPVKRVDHWVTLLRARAIENLAYVVGVNRAGADPKYIYPGRSLIVDPHGSILTDCGPNEGICSAKIDPEEVKRWRREFPALEDIHFKPAEA